MKGGPLHNDAGSTSCLSSTLALFALGTSGLSWGHRRRRSVTPPTAPRNGAGPAGTSVGGASTEDVAAAWCHPTVAPLPRPAARGDRDDWSPAHSHPLADRPPSRQGASRLGASALVTPPLVHLGPGAPGHPVPAGPGRPTGRGAPGGRGHGGSTAGPPRLRQGPASRRRALDPQGSGVSVGTSVGRVVGAGHGAVGRQALGTPSVGRLVASPGRGSNTGDAPSNASASRPAAVGPREALGSSAPVPRWGGAPRRPQRDRPVLSPTRPSAHVGPHG